MFEKVNGIYTKAVVAAFVSAVAAYQAANADASVSTPEWFGVAAAFLVAFGAVWAVPNTPEGVRKWGKMITGGLVVLATSLGVAFIDGSFSTTVDLPIVALALLAGLGLTGYVPNAAASDPVVVDGSGKAVVVPVSQEEKLALVERREAGNVAPNVSERITVVGDSDW